VFKLTMEFSEDYPNKAPVVKFRTRMYHPNSELCRWLALQAHRDRGRQARHSEWGFPGEV
jgi:hypothetical protein